MARSARRASVAGCAPSDLRPRRGRRPPLDWGSARGMGSARAAAPIMTPPPGAARFIATAGWAGARIEPLAGDASFRRYFRVIDGDRSAVLMDAPPAQEDSRPFLAVAEH